MKKSSEFYLDVEIWRSGCWIVWNVNRKQAEDWLNNKFKPNEPFEVPTLDTAQAVTLKYSPFFIFLTEWKFDPENIAVLTHECVHVANHILERCGVEEKDSCDEALAYLVGYLVESFLKALTKKI
jgi:hypothetical protein